MATGALAIQRIRFQARMAAFTLNERQEKNHENSWTLALRVLKVA